MSDWGNLIVNVMKLTGCCYAETVYLGLDAGYFESYLCPMIHLMNGKAEVTGGDDGDSVADQADDDM